MVIPVVPPAQVIPANPAPLSEYQLTRMAAEKGDIHAMSFLGAMYFNGKGIPEDKPLAMVWFSKAAALGEPMAQAVMGLAAINGFMTKRDPIAAYQWMLRSALNGNLDIIPTLLRVRQELSAQEVAEANKRVLTSLP
jgi:TPR repeat protein